MAAPILFGMYHRGVVVERRVPRENPLEETGLQTEPVLWFIKLPANEGIVAVQLNELLRLRVDSKGGGVPDDKRAELLSQISRLVVLPVAIDDLVRGETVVAIR